MNEGLDDLIYSSEANAARFLLYQGLNDINLIVEDEGMQFVYETIFKRLLEDKYNIKTIFPMGGKPKVKEGFLEFGEMTDGVRNIYIVDGDFDRYIHQDQMIDNPCFIYLKTYNIENYYLDEDACLQFAKGHLKCLDNVLKKKVDFNNWKKRIVCESAKLFLCYCFVQKFHPEIETISRSPFLFINDKTGFERDGAFQRYWDETIITLDNNAQDKIIEIDTLYKSINGEDYFNLICGKFLLDSLCAYLRNLFKETFNKKEFKWHLINHFDITKLDYVKNAILSADYL